MKNTKSTKHALLTSVMALFLCVTMLLGTTFAWFTDTVTSGVNTIVAGNLDIEVQYSTDGTSWADLEGTRSLFSDNLWEPGHTEVVYLKIANAGTLALNYKVLVTPVSESGGVNVNGQSFKLSDYLVFGTTAPATTRTTYTRDEARAAVGATTGLNVNNLTKTGTMVGKTDAATDVQYLALVVYMPEDVGNEANYKTGTAAPTIELGIKVIATQKTAENDSFGTDYDTGAVTDSFYTVGSYYDYFPQVSASKTVTVNSDNTVASATTIEATGKLNKNDTTETTLAKVTVPSGVALVPGTTELTVNVVPKEAESATNTGLVAAGETAENGRETANFDIKVEGIATTNTANINVEVFVGKGLSNVKVYHNGTPIEGADYNAATGIVTFSTTSFSDYTVAYDTAAAAIGDKTYGTLELAVNAAQSGETVTLIKDADVLSKIEVTKSLTLNMNGYKLTAKTKASRMLWVTAPNVTLTINGTAAGSGMVIGDTHAASNTEKVWGFVDLRAGSEGSKVVVNGGSYTGSVCANDNYNYGSMFMNRSSSEIVLNNVVVETDVCVLNNSTGGKVTVNDSKVNITGIDAYLTAAFYTGSAEAEFNNVDLTAKYGGCVQVGKKATLNNCNIVVTDVRTGDGTHQNCAVAVQNNGTVTINSGSYSAPYAVYVYNSGGTFDIYGGDFKASGAVLKADKGAINVYGGTFDGAYSINNATLTIKGGTFSSDPSDYVAIGYYVKVNGDWFEVAEKVFSCGANTELNATIPDGVTPITTQDELNAALSAAAADGTTTLYIGEGTFSINTVNCDTKNITFIGAGFDKTNLYYGTNPFNPGGEAGSNYCFEGSEVKFHDVTLIDGNGDNVNYKGFVRCAGLTFDNCVLKSLLTYLGENGVVSFNNCTFETPKYAAWIYSSQTYNFANCLFNSPTGRFLNVYSETNIAPVINATECRFIDSSDGSDSNAVFNIKSSAMTTLTITDCVVSGASPMYKVAADNGTVVKIDGKLVYGTLEN